MLGLAVVTGRSRGGEILPSRKVNPTKIILCTQLHVLGRAVSAAWIVAVHNPSPEDQDLGVELLFCYCWSAFLIP